MVARPRGTGDTTRLDRRACFTFVGEQALRSLIIFLAMTLAAPASGQTANRFSFDGEAAGHVAVSRDARYDPERGYGWEDAGRFSVRLPEGNYRVTIVLGGAAPSEYCAGITIRRDSPLSRTLVVVSA